MKFCAQAPSQPEYSLCGDAFDAPDTEDDVEPFEFAKPGQVVTCEKCRLAIHRIREAFPRGFKVNKVAGWD